MPHGCQRLRAFVLAAGPFLLFPSIASAQFDTSIRDVDPTWGWSMRLARIASRPGGAAVLEPGLLEFEFTKPLEGGLWRRDLDDGWSVGDGFGVRLETGYRRPIGKNVVARARFRATAHAGVPDRVRFFEGGVWGETGPVRWSVGRQRFFWSPTPETALLLTNNAPPLDAASVGTARSLAIPFGLGRFSVQTMLAYLDDEHRVIPYPLLWGAQAYWEPFPSLRFDVRRTAMFGGAGRTQKLTAGDLVDIFLGRGENIPADQRGPDDSDQYLSYAVRWRWPLPTQVRLWAYGWGLRDLELFGEYGGTDAVRRGFPTAVARQMGMRLRIHSWEILGLYTETVADNPWYEHVVYRNGYRYRGWILGHPPGGDARWVRLRVGNPWLNMDGVSLEATWERGNVMEGPVWEATRLTGRWWKDFIPGLRGQVTGDVGFAGADEDAVPPRFPAFALRLSVIFGNPMEFNELAP